MEVPNLAESRVPEVKPALLSLPVIIIIVVLAIASGFWISRFSFGSTSKNSSTASNPSGEQAVSAENISSSDQLQVGKLYGDTHKNFTDKAIGTIEKGSINGEGTHILNREGGKTQRASLTSATVDLDLFVGKKVEVQGQTNASTKTGWLLDVGSIKILE